MIRLATLEDQSEVERMGRAFLEASGYTLRFDQQSFSSNYSTLLQNKKSSLLLLALSTKTDTSSGMLIAAASKPLFSSDVVATEIVWWVDPEYRGSMSSIRLLEAYEYWAENVAKAKFCQMGHLGDSRLDKMYTKRGYRKSEICYIKEF